MRLLAALCLVLAAAACGGTGGFDQGEAPPTASPAATPAPSPSPIDCHNAFKSQMEQQTAPPATQIDASKSYMATIHTKRGEIVVKLDTKAAPATVNNFVALARGGFYDCLTFHRVEDFVVQGGDPSGNGTGGPGYKLPDETNPAPWLRGSLGMASNQLGVNGSQFFILKQDATYLSQSGVYNHFGVVTAGMDVVDKIAVGDEIEGIDIAES